MIDILFVSAIMDVPEHWDGKHALQNRPKMNRLLYGCMWVVGSIAVFFLIIFAVIIAALAFFEGLYR